MRPDLSFTALGPLNWSLQNCLKPSDHSTQLLPLHPPFLQVWHLRTQVSRLLFHNFLCGRLPPQMVPNTPFHSRMGTSLLPLRGMVYLLYPGIWVESCDLLWPVECPASLSHKIPGCFRFCSVRTRDHHAVQNPKLAARRRTNMPWVSQQMLTVMHVIPGETTE